MTERLWDILKEPDANNTTKTVVIGLLDGTDPFLFMRDPMAQTWLVFRETEKNIEKALGLPMSFFGSDKKSELKEGDNSNISIFPDAQIIEVESESVFIDVILTRAKEEAANAGDFSDTRLTFYQRLKHLLEKGS